VIWVDLGDFQSDQGSVVSKSLVMYPVLSR